MCLSRSPCAIALSFNTYVLNLVFFYFSFFHNFSDVLNLVASIFHVHFMNVFILFVNLQLQSTAGRSVCVSNLIYLILKLIHRFVRTVSKCSVHIQTRIIIYNIVFFSTSPSSTALSLSSSFFYNTFFSFFHFFLVLLSIWTLYLLCSLFLLCVGYYFDLFGFFFWL